MNSNACDVKIATSLERSWHLQNSAMTASQQIKLSLNKFLIILVEYKNKVPQMLYTLLNVLSQKPPTPTPNNNTDILPSPIILIAIAIILVGAIAWKYKAYLQFAAITCATVGGFMKGLISTPPYTYIGLGTMTSLATLFLSTAIIIIIKLARK